MKNNISLDDVKKLGRLSELEITEEQAKKMLGSIVSIVEHMSEIANMKEIDDTPKTARIGQEKNIWRDDTVGESLSQSNALKNAKKTHNGYFVIPQLVEEK